MSAKITNEHDNYFSAGLDAYVPNPESGGSLSPGVEDYELNYDCSKINYATNPKNACIPIRRNNLGLTYDRGILIPYTLDVTDQLYNFYPRVNVTYDDDFKIKCTARIKILKASYDSTPVSMTVGLGLAGSTGDLNSVDTSFLVHSDEGWVDLAIIGIVTKSSTSMIINFKIGQFDSNPDCLLLCDNWNAEIFDE